MTDTLAPGAILVPSHCPKCRSKAVTTASKVVSAESYWRCGGCGEVWNAGRRREAGEHRPIRPGWR
jgi:transposase-like protein